MLSDSSKTRDNFQTLYGLEIPRLPNQAEKERTAICFYIFLSHGSSNYIIKHHVPADAKANRNTRAHTSAAKKKETKSRGFIYTATRDDCARSISIPPHLYRRKYAPITYYSLSSSRLDNAECVNYFRKRLLFDIL